MLLYALETQLRSDMALSEETSTTMTPSLAAGFYASRT